MGITYLGKDALSTVTLKREEIDVPEWGGKILVRELTARELSLVQAQALGAVDVKNGEVLDATNSIRMMGLFIVLGWINEDGTHVLAETDIDAVLDHPPALLERIAKVIGDLSNFNVAPAEVKKN